MLIGMVIGFAICFLWGLSPNENANYQAFKRGYELGCGGGVCPVDKNPVPKKIATFQTNGGMVRNEDSL